uniref:Uncharacterized protein n=1 Tax=Arundo donax TaxID=35708 RepID=A0A0A9BIZ9_ARUDO
MPIRDGATSTSLKSTSSPWADAGSNSSLPNRAALSRIGLLPYRIELFFTGDPARMTMLSTEAIQGEAVSSTSASPRAWFLAHERVEHQFSLRRGDGLQELKPALAAQALVGDWVCGVPGS